MHSAAEAKAYVRELYLRMRYADVSEANLYYGNMRFDVNVSVSKTAELGTRTETKNLNSFRAVEKAVEYEVTRQIEELEKGNKIIQETRGWDDAKQKTFSQRTKENADDYRYFPDPDLPPIVLTDEYIEQIHAEMPVMPDEWRDRLGQLSLDKSYIETLLDAQVEQPDARHLEIVEAVLNREIEEAKNLINWKVNIEIPLRNEDKVSKVVETERLSDFYSQLYGLVKDKKLSSTNAKALIVELLGIDELPHNVEKYAEEKGYIQVSDEGEIAAIVAKVIEDNPKPVQDVQNGEMKAIGFLVGQVMKASQGKANPALAQQLIKKQLGI
jgi:aspartyl-tRNA(Asn)/glutamyl-tRNA(Gln) amidotransferase subunit B